MYTPCNCAAKKPTRVNPWLEIYQTQREYSEK